MLSFVHKIGHRFSAYRRLTGKDQAEFAKSAGFSRSTVSGIENGHRGYLNPNTKKRFIAIGIPKELFEPPNGVKSPGYHRSLNGLSTWKKYYKEFPTLSRALQVEFGERIAARRIAKGLSQSELARAIDVSDASFISSIENGSRYPSLQPATKLARALGCSLRELLDPKPPLKNQKIVLCLADFRAWKSHFTIFSGLNQRSKRIYLNALGRTLVAIREEMGLSQKKFALRISEIGERRISQSYICQFENAKEGFPQVEVAIALAKGLGRTIDEFFEGQ